MINAIKNRLLLTPVRTVLGVAIESLTTMTGNWDRHLPGRQIVAGANLFGVLAPMIIADSHSLAAPPDLDVDLRVGWSVQMADSELIENRLLAAAGLGDDPHSAAAGASVGSSAVGRWLAAIPGASAQAFFDRQGGTQDGTVADLASMSCASLLATVADRSR